MATSVTSASEVEPLSATSEAEAISEALSEVEAISEALSEVEAISAFKTL